MGVVVGGETGGVGVEERRDEVEGLECGGDGGRVGGIGCKSWKNSIRSPGSMGGVSMSAKRWSRKSAAGLTVGVSDNGGGDGSGGNKES